MAHQSLEMELVQVRESIRYMLELQTTMDTMKRDLNNVREEYKQCEQCIIDYLLRSEQPGVIFQNTTILLKTRAKRQYTSQQERLERAKDYFEEKGIPETEESFKEFLKSMQKPHEVDYTLKCTFLR